MTKWQWQVVLIIISSIILLMPAHVRVFSTPVVGQASRIVAPD
ncbi:hypothetical protein [Lactobacillus sp. CBA3606]|nr:hypothetical protein [Lactobacillus sp. CBA3606]